MGDAKKICDKYREVQGFWPSLDRYKWLMREISTNQRLQELGTEAQFVWKQVKGTVIIKEDDETFEEFENIAAYGLELDRSKPKGRIEHICK